MMKLTSEKLLTAIKKYAQLPEKQRNLTQKQIDWFTNPENVFLLITLVLTLPKETMTEMGDSISSWVEVAIAELALTTNKLPVEARQQFEEAIEYVLAYTKENYEINSECVLLCLSILKKHQFHINTDITHLLDTPEYADSTNIATFPQKQPRLSQLFDQFEIQSGIEFIEFFETGFSVAPAETLPHLLSEVAHYSWGIDALLLLTQYFEEPVALASAQALDNCPSSAWANLSYLQLLNLCTRFNRHSSIKHCFKRWKKRALAHSKARKTAEIHEIHASHVDGNDCASMMIKVTLDNQVYQLNMMLDFKSGIRETLLNLDPEQSLTELIAQLDPHVDFTSVSPDWLQQVLPWVLSVQSNKNTPLDLYSLYWLSRLPFEWTQPEAFDFEYWSQKLGYQANRQRQERNRLSLMTGYSPLIMSWLAPEEYILAATTPKDLLKRYYYANRELFTERLTYSAAVERYKLPPQAQRLTNDYLDLAHTLSDPTLSRKKFALFDTLSEFSFEYFTAAMDLIDAEMPLQGLVIKISLLDASPAVWRRIKVSNQLTLNEFHDVIQNAMGWENAHLFRFDIMGTEIPEEHYDQVRIGVFLNDTGDYLSYQYDFGDDWFHLAIVEKVLQKDITLPVVTAGKGMCPAEDSGGIFSWNHLLKLRKKKILTEDEAEQLDWAGLSPGEELEPFDKERANQMLKKLFSE
ncbi:plasmid pRiA4b ORF-3 family protein [Xenorhabdus khoisanae]|uniref:plasmid pRiA4b ORF-3 family protein n=1 Tax=Xenorhabdus khoisanae TaxID=880157 RepID=UPI0023599FDA|nr:plasmid pRiA4b ORF-3 family protein [Xenorhabdus khoisanae]MDC9613358.1 plasmid pRiA4b ORF-3 family protein [Xenorhabdus khoisanae]